MAAAGEMAAASRRNGSSGIIEKAIYRKKAAKIWQLAAWHGSRHGVSLALENGGEKRRISWL